MESIVAHTHTHTHIHTHTHTHTHHITHTHTHTHSMVLRVWVSLMLGSEIASYVKWIVWFDYNRTKPCV